MTFDDRVRALEAWGFSKRQTRFLVTVALHSGFCLHRHYAAFAGLAYGEGVRDFFDRLVARRLATRLTFRRDRGHVYHLQHSAIYEAIGQDDNRNRRQTSPALIARKLMLLDFVLAHVGAEWYATEQDKVRLFTDRWGVPIDDLPSRIYTPRRDTSDQPTTTRYFIHKLPIRLVGEGPTVSFTFLVTDTSGRAFAQFLRDHERLLHHLHDWEMVAVYPQHIAGASASAATFRDFVADVQRRLSPSEPEAVRAFFQDRQRIEDGDMSRWSIDDLRQFQIRHRRFLTPEFRTLYQRWQQEGDAVFAEHGDEPLRATLASGRPLLTMHRLPVRYDRFGTRAGVS
jgi:hypothetical protein